MSGYEFVEDWRPTWEWIDENLNRELVKKIDALLAEDEEEDEALPHLP